MLLRRALYFAQFPLAIALPAWVLVSRGIIADGIGAQLIVYIVICPIVTLALGAISGLIVARKGVRLERAISWRDAEWQGAIWLSLFGYGLFAFPLLAVLVVLLIIVGFWFEVIELFNETRARVKVALDLGPTDGRAKGPGVSAPGRYSGQVIVIEPNDDPRKP